MSVSGESVVPDCVRPGPAPRNGSDRVSGAMACPTYAERS